MTTQALRVDGVMPLDDQIKLQVQIISDAESLVRHGADRERHALETIAALQARLDTLRRDIALAPERARHATEKLEFLEAVRAKREGEPLDVKRLRIIMERRARLIAQLAECDATLGATANPGPETPEADPTTTEQLPPEVTGEEVATQ